MVDYVQEMIKTPRGWLILAIMLLAVLMTNAFHEGGHALVAWLSGDRRSSIRERATLNPLKHFHWLLTLVLPLASIWFLKALLFGAKPVMIDAGRIGPRRMALAALAGPIGNFLFCGVILAGFGFALSQEWVDPVNPLKSVAWRSLKPVLWFSAVLGLFNLIPLPPLDGSRVVGMFLPERARAIWYRLAPLGILVLLVFSFWLGGFLARFGMGRGHPEVFTAVETKMESYLFEMRDFWEGW